MDFSFAPRSKWYSVTISDGKVKVDIDKQHKKQWIKLLSKHIHPCCEHFLQKTRGHYFFADERYSTLEREHLYCIKALRLRELESHLEVYLNRLSGERSSDIYYSMYGDKGWETLPNDVICYILLQACVLIDAPIIWLKKDTDEFRDQEYTQLLEILSRSGTYQFIPTGTEVRVYSDTGSAIRYLRTNRSIKILHDEMIDILEIAARHGVKIPCDGYALSRDHGTITLFPGRSIQHGGYQRLSYTLFPGTDIIDEASICHTDICVRNRNDYPIRDVDCEISTDMKSKQMHTLISEPNTSRTLPLFNQSFRQRNRYQPWSTAIDLLNIS